MIGYGTCAFGHTEPYRHFEHEVLLAEAEAQVCHRPLEEAGGPQDQNEVQVPRKGGLRVWERGRE